MRAAAATIVPPRSTDDARTLASIAAAVTLADLLTKQIAVARLANGGGLAFGDAVRLTLLHNRGLAWGLTGGGQALAITFAGTALLLVAVAAVRRPLAAVDPASPRMLGFIVGAALGNAISLLLWPGAPDFIALDTGGGTETVINVADVALLVGLALCCRTTWRIAMALRPAQELRTSAALQPQLGDVMTTAMDSPARIEQRDRPRRPLELEIPLVVAREDEQRAPLERSTRRDLPLRHPSSPADRGGDAPTAT